MNTNKIFLYPAIILQSFSLFYQSPFKVKSITNTSKKQKPHGKISASQKVKLTQAQLLQGAWAECSDCNFDFSLEKNKVIFYDPGTDGKQEVVYWKVSNNRLSFIYKGGLVVTDVITKINKDSLVLYRIDKSAGIAGYSRFVRLK